MTQRGRRTGVYQQKRGETAEAIAGRVTDWVGSSKGLTAAVLVVVIWAMSGPFFGWSNTWQLVINTGTDQLVVGSWWSVVRSVRL